ncbi:MAG TPA: 4-hydroxybenzoate 3-monooxygenase [Saprospiraceae bacterium]|nr:4-hydroxybenzoate 3-monooxygenase [Saprospiraceae bacterium]HNT21519.1 4-hydroxybenzoate 3-monooxygenase [Saprospiraceae bacterium]
MKTSVAIIGAGPAGLSLALLLHQAGIPCLILERHSRAYVESRVRAGLLEQNTVDLFTELGVAGRLRREGLEHFGVILSFEGERLRIPFDELTGGRHITIYGQQEVVKDLVAACLERQIEIRFEAKAWELHRIETEAPYIQYIQDGTRKSLACDFIAACDGFHGIGRKFLPPGSYIDYQTSYPFSWLGILAETAPSSEELIYTFHEEGFALHSLRSDAISRFYLQVDNTEKLEDWDDSRIWESLEKRLFTPGFKLQTGRILEKSITPVRSYMTGTMQSGRLFLAGDAAHIVPPTGGKGLNLAVADIRWLAKAMIAFYKSGDEQKLRSYSQDCLRRIWRVQDFSHFMTQLFHRIGERESLEYRLQRSKFDYLKISRAYQTSLAENYVGLKEI